MVTRDDHALLFVYGTLSTAVDHPLGAFMRAHSEHVGAGSFAGRLFVVDDPDAPGEASYPAAVLSDAADERVYGEVYRLRNLTTVLPQLDDYEACSPNWPEPWEYERREISATLADDGRAVRTWIYLYAAAYDWNLRRGHRIASGRYRGERWSPDRLIPATAPLAATGT